MATSLIYNAMKFKVLVSLAKKFQAQFTMKRYYKRYYNSHTNYAMDFRSLESNRFAIQQDLTLYILCHRALMWQFKLFINLMAVCEHYNGMIIVIPLYRKSYFPR